MAALEQWKRKDKSAPLIQVLSARPYVIYEKKVVSTRIFFHSLARKPYLRAPCFYAQNLSQIAPAVPPRNSSTYAELFIFHISWWL